MNIIQSGLVHWASHMNCSRDDIKCIVKHKEKINESALAIAKNLSDENKIKALKKFFRDCQDNYESYKASAEFTKLNEGCADLLANLGYSHLNEEDQDEYASFSKTIAAPLLRLVEETKFLGTKVNMDELQAASGDDKAIGSAGFERDEKEQYAATLYLEMELLRSYIIPLLDNCKLRHKGDKKLATMAQAIQAFRKAIVVVKCLPFELKTSEAIKTAREIFGENENIFLLQLDAESALYHLEVKRDKQLWIFFNALAFDTWRGEDGTIAIALKDLANYMLLQDIETKGVRTTRKSLKILRRYLKSIVKYYDNIIALSPEE